MIEKLKQTNKFTHRESSEEKCEVPPSFTPPTIHDSDLKLLLLLLVFLQLLLIVQQYTIIQNNNTL